MILLVLFAINISFLLYPISDIFMMIL